MKGLTGLIILKARFTRTKYSAPRTSRTQTLILMYCRQCSSYLRTVLTGLRRARLFIFIGCRWGMFGLVLLAMPSLHGAEVSSSASLSSSNTIHLEMVVRGTNGVVLVQGIDGLSLTGTPDLVASFQIAHDDKFVLDLPLDGNARFFLVQTSEGNREDYEATPLDGDEPDPSALADIGVDAPGNYADGGIIELSIVGRSELGNSVEIRRCFTIYLGDEEGNPWPTSASLTPSRVCVAGSTLTTNVVIQAAGDVSQASLWLVPVEETTRPAARPQGLTPGKGKRASKSTPCVVAVSASFQYPLQGGIVYLAGTFGEYPGHAAIHKGVDLSAGVGTIVVASKAGWVRQNSALADDPSNKKVDAATGKCIPNTVKGVGGLIALDHGDGTQTRYLHVAPDSNLLRGSCVTQGQPIAKVASFTGIPIHLHFETLKAWEAENPADLIPDLVKGDKAPPVFRGLFFRSDNPASSPVTGRTRVADLDGSEVFVEVDIAEKDSRGGSANMAPRRLDFLPENSKAVSLDFSNNKTVTGFYQKSGGSGGIPMVDSADLSNTSIRYPYWFGWDTTAYQNDLVGPRHLGFTAVDSAGNSSTLDFRVGPEIQNKTSLAFRSGSVAAVNVGWVMSPFPAGQSGTQNVHEKLILELTTESTLADKVATFALNNLTDMEIDVGTAAAASIQIKVPTSAFVKPETVYTLTAKSEGFPGLGDRVQIFPADRAVLSTSGNNGKSFQLTFSGGSLASPSTSQVALPAHSSKYIVLPGVTVGTEIQLQLLAQWPGENLLWGYTLDLKPGWVFTSVKSDKDAAPKTLSGTTHSDSLFKNLSTSHNGNTYTLKFQGP